MTDYSASAIKRFWDRVDKSGTCWLWTGPVNLKGYGQFVPSSGLPHLGAHRFAYIIAKGAIPDGLVIDHLCRVRNCVNPDHLEPVTNKVNILRGISPSAKNARKTHCVNGHAFTKANTYYRRRPGAETDDRECRECNRAIDRRRRARERQARAAAKVAS